MQNIFAIAKEKSSFSRMTNRFSVLPNNHRYCTGDWCKSPNGGE
jgi:hypothetical protein